MSDSIKFGISTWVWESPFSSETLEIFPKIKEMGFDLVEIPVEDPALINTKEVRAVLDNNDLVASVCGVFGPSKDLTADDEALQNNCFDYLKRCFAICAELDVKFLAGPMYSAVGKARLVSQEQRLIEWERAVLNLRKVCKLAQEYDLAIALEPLNRFESDLVNSAEDVMRLIQDIGEDNAGVLLDGFHMTIEEKNIKEAIKLVGEKLIHVQVSENHRGIPGTGLTPWLDFADGLSDIDYNGAVVIESFTPEVKELAAAVCIWKKMAPNQDEFAIKGLEFLKKTL